MKRTHNQRNQHSSPIHVTRNTRTPLMRNQALFRNHSESGDNAIIRNNNLQLSFSEDQINPESLLSFGAYGGQFRPHSASLNQHRAARPAAMIPMNGYAFGGRQFISCPRFFQQNFRSAFNYYARSHSQRIPGTTRQFQETQQHWMQQRNYMRTSTISASEINNTGRKANCYLDKRKHPMRRKWQAMAEVEQCRPNEFSFSLVTYNMLSDSLLYENMFLYQDCNKDYLSWGCRKEKLLAELLGYEAEILCLQEVDASHYENWFLPKLHEAGYMGLFVQRTGGKPDGCAIFYRHAKFTLVNHKLVRFLTPKVQILDKDNVGIVLLLKANTPDLQEKNSFICVANTHLLFNKKRGDIKLAQLAYLLAEINELAVLSQDDHCKTHCPVLLCGDLNSLPYSPLYHFLMNGQLDYSARSPAVISGQLAPSDARRGPSSKQIRTPLLPWEFGVTADCQWRNEQESKSEGRSAHIQDKDIHDSERDMEWRRKPDCSHPSERCESMSSIQADPCRSETRKHVDSNICSDFPRTTSTNRYVQTSEMKGLKIHKDSKEQPNPGQDEWNKGLSERGKSERNSAFVDLTRETESPGPHNSRAAEKNRVGISNRDPDLNRSTESSGHNSGAGEQHSHTSLPIVSSEKQTEKTNYNKNGSISIPWQFKSVYTHRFRDGTPEVTTCHSKACCNVDYIFYTGGVRDGRDAKHKEYVQTGKLTLLGKLELMGKTDFNTMRLLPNHIFPSDHLSLQARFKLT